MNQSDQDPVSGMQSIFNTTRCYDIMQESNKVIMLNSNLSSRAPLITIFLISNLTNSLM